MGVQGASSVLFHLDNLSISHVLNAAKRLKEKWGHTEPPTIIIDANWVACRGAPTSDAVAYTIDVICALKASGFGVLVVFDPPLRHYTKVASIRRIGEREAARADAYKGRNEIMRISEQLLDDNLSPGERDSLETARKRTQTKMKTAEKKSSSSFPPIDFRLRVQDEISRRRLNDSGNDFVESVTWTTGLFQADSRIEKLVESGCGQVILANDADYSFLLGEHCLQIQSFKLDSKHDTLKDIVVKSGFKSVITDVIDPSGDLKDCIIEPVDYPLIDGKTDVRFRLSVGLALGCDVFPGGIPGVGAKTVADAIQKQPENGDDEVTHLLTVLSNSSKCLASLDELNVLVDAWLYEPCTPLDENGDDDYDTISHEYVFEPPQHYLFDAYLEDFAGSFYNIADGVDFLECHGHSGQSPHRFLKSFGIECKECKSLCCPWCCYDFKPSRYTPSSTLTCLKCYASEIPALETMNEMRQEIINAGLQVPEDVQLNELQDLYDAVISRGDIEIEHESHYPLLCTAQLRDGTLRTLCSFDFQDGARFIHDDALSTVDLVGLIHLLAKMVTYSGAYITDDMSREHEHATRALPDIVNKFVSGSRKDGGERMKKRTLRHALDSKTLLCLVGRVMGRMDHGHEYRHRKRFFHPMGKER